MAEGKKCLGAKLLSLLPKVCWNHACGGECACSDCKCRDKKFYGLKWESAAVGISVQGCQSKDKCCGGGACDQKPASE